PEQGPLVHGPGVHGEPLEERRDLLDAGEDAESPVGLGEALEPDLGLDALSDVSRVQDLDGAREVDVGDLARSDLGLGGYVEGAFGMACHKRPRSLSGSRKSAAIVPEYRGEVNRGAGRVASQPPG